MTVYFIIPGNLHSLTGGYVYNLHIINGLKQKGHTVNVLGTTWPWKIRERLETICRSRLKNLPHSSLIIIDSLILTSLNHIIQEFPETLKFIALMHLPVSYDIRSGIHGKLAENELQCLHLVSGIIVTGRFTFDLLCNSGLTPDKMRVAEPGVEQYPRKEKYKMIPSELVCIANYSPLKAQDILIRALFRLREWEWTLHLYGDKSRHKKYSAGIRLLIRQLGLEQRIVLHGIVERNEISTVLQNADLFVLPSLFESYGMALTEALAHGIPVVTTRTGNIPYTVPAGMGLLTEPANEDDLAKALLTLFDDPVRYSGLCTAASQYYRQARSWENVVEEIEMIFLKMRKSE